MVKEIEIPIKDNKIYKKTVRSLKDFKDITCKVKIVAKRIWETEDRIGTYDIIEAVNGSEKGERYSCLSAEREKKYMKSWNSFLIDPALYEQYKKYFPYSSLIKE
jgi:hypothetical protein